ncbi:MAG: hypothetical protein PWR03_305 [Tenuifilum sp.]|uniref:hypothetical protein n=1 Tax=Tenuifilum sp. TaxID=2760880 RepID=UPI0024AAD979|nr:hypothetical protein [Tenuifilum sp.]MDI3526122.1 hypothetical protein [Tenuifilum sp.]
MTQIFKNIRNRYYEKIISIPNHLYEGKDLVFLRNDLFFSILLITFFFGILAYIPSVFFSVEHEKYAIGIIDTIAIATITYITFSRKLSITTKKIIFVVNAYILALILFIYLGIKGPATIVLFSISLLSTLFFSKRVGLISVAINAAVYFSLPFTINNLIPGPNFFNDLTVNAWLIIGFNLIIFNTI